MTFKADCEALFRAGQDKLIPAAALYDRIAFNISSGIQDRAQSINEPNADFAEQQTQLSEAGLNEEYSDYYEDAYGQKLPADRDVSGIASLSSAWQEVESAVYEIFGSAGANLRDGGNTLMLLAWSYAETDDEAADELRDAGDLEKDASIPNLTKDGEWE